MSPRRFASLRQQRVALGKWPGPISVPGGQDRSQFLVARDLANVATRTRVISVGGATMDNDAHSRRHRHARRKRRGRLHYRVGNRRGLSPYTTPTPLTFSPPSLPTTVAERPFRSPATTTTFELATPRTRARRRAHTAPDRRRTMNPNDASNPPKDESKRYRPPTRSKRYRPPTRSKRYRRTDARNAGRKR